MTASSRANQVLLLPALFLCLFVFVRSAAGQTTPPVAEKSAQATAAPAAAAPVSIAPTASAPASAASGYAGAGACATCHAPEYKSWEGSAHWNQTYREGGIAKHGCEDCHGAAASHVADPTDTSKLFLFEKASAKDINQRCLTCHAGGTSI